MTKGFNKLATGEGVDESIDGATCRIGAGTNRGHADVGYERGETVGRYVILGQLGAGGMSVVYSAYDPDLDRKVAIKVLRTDAELAADLESSGGSTGSPLWREAQALAKLSHPNVVPVFDVGTLDGRVFIAMEQVEGQTLAAWLDEKSRSWRDVVARFIQAGKGLAAAHAAGLIHRDFKPHNVLVGHDETVRVMDFGLAGPLSAVAARTSTDDHVTEVATVMGTPAYMAPEQHEGASVDAKADQYAFCVALYRGLYGCVPFARGSSRQILADKKALRLQPTPPRRERRVPRWLRKVVIRGLDPDPSRRWSGMPDVLHALQKDPGRTFAKATAVVAGVGIALAGGWVYGQARERQRAVCSGAIGQVAGVWDPSVRSAAEQRFLGTGLNYAGETWQRVDSMVEARVQQWTVAHQDACEATHVRKEQSPAIMDLRMACLDRQLRDLKSTAKLFAAADGKVVQNAVKVVSNLEAVQSCSRIDRLQRGPSLPPEDKQDRVADLQRLLADSQALQRAGKFNEALEVADKLFKAAEELDYSPLIAESQFTLGRLQYDVGNYETAEKTLAEAGWLAEAIGHDEFAARAQIVIVATVGDKLRRKAEGLTWARHAESAVTRVAPNEELEASLWTSIGSMHSAHGDFARAKEFHQRALEVDHRARGPDHLSVAIHHNNLGTAAARLHQIDEASASFRRAIEIFEQQIGPSHPNVGVALLNFGATLSLASRHEEAREPLERSIRILEAALGENHPYLAHAAQNLAAVCDALGEHDEAARLLRRSLAIQKIALGPTHPTVAELLWSLTSTLSKAGRLEETETVVAELRALADDDRSADPLVSAWRFLSEGRLLVLREQYSQALPWFEKGAALLQENPTFPEDLVVWTLLGLGQSLREVGRPTEAIPVLERIVARSPAPAAHLRGRARFELARVVMAKGDRVRAKALAEQAIADYAEAGRSSAVDVEEVREWLASKLR